MYVKYSRGLIVISINRRYKMFILLTNRSVIQILKVRLGDVYTAWWSTDEWERFTQTPDLMITTNTCSFRKVW